MSDQIVTGQKIAKEKLARAKELRKEMTQAEAVLWQHLRRNQLNNLHFRRQQVVHGLIVDFYCHKARLVVEVDGDIHDEQTEQDQARDQVLQELGLKVLRVQNEDVIRNPKEVLQRIQSISNSPLPLREGAGG